MYNDYFELSMLLSNLFRVFPTLHSREIVRDLDLQFTLFTTV